MCGFLIRQVSRQNSHPWCRVRLDKRLYTATCTHVVQFGVQPDLRQLPRAVCGRLRAKWAVQNTCGRVLPNILSRKRPFSTGRRGQMGSCLCMKCNIIIDLQDDLKIVKISSVVHEIYIFENFNFRF